MKIEPRAIAGIVSTIWVIIVCAISMIFNVNLFENKIVWIIGLIFTLVTYLLFEKRYYDGDNDE